MWKHVRNSWRKWWENISVQRLDLITAIAIIIATVTVVIAAWFGNMVLVFIGFLLMVITVALLFIIEIKKEEIRERKQEESEKKHNEEVKKRIENIFKGREEIEVRLVPRNIYPYYTKIFYNELGNLIFLHMLVFVQEKTEFKCYAEWEDDVDVLMLSIVTDNPGNDLNNKRVFDEFPQ